MGAAYPVRSVASVEDQLAAVLAVLDELEAMQGAARDPALVRRLELAIRRQRGVAAWLRQLRREMGYGARPDDGGPPE